MLHARRGVVHDERWVRAWRFERGGPSDELLLVMLRLLVLVLRLCQTLLLRLCCRHRLLGCHRLLLVLLVLLVLLLETVRLLQGCIDGLVRAGRR
tara:strand:- start:295 stop:579 length:285 start_codon:yes stop_codon:yes gene_type:complete